LPDFPGDERSLEVTRARIGNSPWTLGYGLGTRVVLRTNRGKRLNREDAQETTAEQGDGMNEIEIITTASLGDTSYLLVSGDEAALVDPQRDSWALMESCTSRGVRIRYALETHVHNDYVSGALEVRAATGATVAGPARAPYAFDHLPLAENDEIAVGDVIVRAMETPGHTVEHTSYLVLEDSQPVPTAVFTGGSLLVGSAGRTDLSGDDHTEELARAQFRSLRRLSLLPDATRVLPTHGAGSSCAAGPVSQDRTTTMGAERRTNPALTTQDEEEFISQRLSGPAPYPAYYRYMAPINRFGPGVLGGPPALRPLTPGMAEGMAAGGAQIVDGRDRGTFAAAHVPGSLCDELDDRFASLIGEVVPFGTRMVLVLPEPAGEEEAADEAMTQLLRIGYENVAGYLEGGIHAWQSDGRPLRAFGTADVSELAARIAEVRVLDVRPMRPEGGIPGTLGVPLAELPGRLDEIPRDREIWTVCGSGRRAIIAASLLDQAGMPVTAVVSGGVQDLMALI
jgi:hydroxyacylglutathione hydrolase